MRGKAKQRVSLILVVTMVLGTALTGNTVFATLTFLKILNNLWNRMLHRQFM